MRLVSARKQNVLLCYLTSIQTDKRVQGVTECRAIPPSDLVLSNSHTKALGVLRMIKLFAWESRIINDLLQRRADELKVSQRQRLVEVLLRQFSSCMPMVAKLATFSVYVRVFFLLLVSRNLTSLIIRRW